MIQQYLNDRIQIRLTSPREKLHVRPDYQSGAGCGGP